ncbi:hypothetical protein [Acanthopleuribacter pedis]|uniref:Uncharacterized protein n=1 Tax=Acanthopleuribacter pedis TaxID=442870 RepID=A0A8J7QDS0_9BACT|nr:hypothetical protein [Acanthopleuribacter pedis]MBO1322692.1 hypothetical protein [Acanthopleuribacter pedis]
MKNIAFHFVLICASLLVCNRRRVNALVFSLDATPAQTLPPLFRDPRREKIAQMLTAAVMVAASGFMFNKAVSIDQQRRDVTPTALDGTYRVIAVDQGEGRRPVTSADRNLWHSFVVAKGGRSGGVKRIDGKVSRRAFRIDEQNQSIRQINRCQNKRTKPVIDALHTPRALFTHAVDWPTPTLHYWWSEQQQLHLFVPTEGDGHWVYTLEKIEPAYFLEERGFNWVNSLPFLIR